MFRIVSIIMAIAISPACVDRDQSIRIHDWELKQAHTLCKSSKIDYIDLYAGRSNFVTCQNGKMYNMDIKITN